MKLQIIALVATCMLCSLSCASAASSLQKRSTAIASALEKIETVVSNARTNLENAIEKANATIQSIEEVALARVDAVVTSVVDAAIDEVTDLIGNNSISDFIDCVDVSSILTTLNEEVLEAVNICVASLLSPITSGVSALLEIEEDLVTLLEEARAVYEECGDTNIVCQLRSLPSVLAELAKTAVKDAKEVISVATSISALTPAALQAKLVTCVAKEAVAVTVTMAKDLASALTSCISSSSS